MKIRDPYCYRFGELIRLLRERAGLSQEEFAEKVGIHRTYIGGIERGERNPTLLTICRLASALGVSPKRLLENITEHLE